MQLTDQPPMARRARAQARRAVALAAAACLSAPPAAFAQVSPGQLPGVVVTIPSAPQPEPEPQKSPPRTAPPKAAPAPKPAAKAPEPQPKSRAAALSGGEGGGGGGGAKIAIRVGDEDIITSQEIDWRAGWVVLQQSAALNKRAQDAFASIVKNENPNEKLRAIWIEVNEANPGRSPDEIKALFEKRKAEYVEVLRQRAFGSARSGFLPKARVEAEKQLIEERLKLKAARDMRIGVDETRVNEIMSKIAKDNNASYEQFAASLKSRGADVRTMESRIRANLAWSEVIRKKFAARISVSERDIDTELAGADVAGERVVIDLHKITLPAAKRQDHRQSAQTFLAAEQIARGFNGCQSSAAAAASVPGAKFEALGKVNADTVAEPTRSFLLDAKVGSMAPPSITGQGTVELYAVCGRTVSKISEEKRGKILQELQNKEIERLAANYLNELSRTVQIDPPRR